MFDLPIILAFSAGLVSFLAPCVLPLIPGYIAYLAGTNLAEAQLHRRAVFLTALSFVLGFSLVFASLGVLLNTVLETLAYDVQAWLSRVGGLLIIFFGVYLTGLIPLPWLSSEHKLSLQVNLSSRYLGAAVFGAAFAAGWTPCVGAVLGGILGLAATQPGSAFILLTVYSLGFGLPFLLVGLFATQVSPVILKISPYLGKINLFFGLLLILFGGLILSQNLQKIANFELVNRLLNY